MKSPLRRYVSFAAGVLATSIVAAFVLRARTALELPRASTPPEAPLVAAGSQARRPAADLARRLPGRRSEDDVPPGGGDPLPRSLRETETDGWIGVDDDGRLLVTPGARLFFDYFLSATGEESADEIRARIAAEIEKRVPPAGAAEAIDLLDRYLSYRDRVRALQQSGPSDDLAARLSDLHDLRVQLFGDANAAALFGEEERIQAVDVERRQVLRDETLSAEQRQRRLDELEQRLPESARQARGETLAALRLTQDEQRLRAAGGSPEDIRALREQRFGSQAADRLAALDGERAAWQQRLDDYHRARQAIADDAAVGDAERARALETLLGERFSPQERLRVEALDRVGE